MDTLSIVPSRDDTQLMAIAGLASEIWHEHFISIIGEEQVDYMIHKFQSFPALKEQVHRGYEYFQIYDGADFAGYTGIEETEGSLFLSKLYIKKEYRGRHLSTRVFEFHKRLCKERGLMKIWLTCNKYNEHTLQVYKHLGFSITREQKADIGNGFYMDDYILEYTLK